VEGLAVPGENNMHVILLAAISVDGCIAQRKEQSSTEWNSVEDKKFFRERSTEAGVLIMGSTTFATFHRALPNRLLLIYTSKPESLAQFDPDHIRAVSGPPAQLLAELAAQGTKEVAIAGGASIYHQFLAAGLVDEVILTVEPVLFGAGVRLLPNEIHIDLVLKKSTRLNEQGTMVMEYAVKK
jgi:dihydrofolate reductase